MNTRILCTCRLFCTLEIWGGMTQWRIIQPSEANKSISCSWTRHMQNQLTHILLRWNTPLHFSERILHSGVIHICITSETRSEELELKEIVSQFVEIMKATSVWLPLHSAKAIMFTPKKGSVMKQLVAVVKPTLVRCECSSVEHFTFLPLKYSPLLTSNNSTLLCRMLIWGIKEYPSRQSTYRIK